MNPINVTREHSLYTMFSQRALQARQSEIAKLNEQMSTTKRINRPSDDPSGYGQARRMEVLSDRYSQYQRSIDSAHTWSTATQGALDKLADLFTDAYESGIRASNGSFSPSDYETIATQLDGVLAEALEVMNTKSGDEYLFSGSRTTVKPFEIDGVSGLVEYAGNANGRKRTIGQDVTLNINISGDRLLEVSPGVTITESIQNMITALRDADSDAISNSIQDLETARDHVIDLGAEAGIIGNRLNSAEEQLSDAMLLVEGRRSDLEDADIAEVFMKFQQEQTGLQAALQSASTILQTTILDYLR